MTPRTSFPSLHRSLLRSRTTGLVAVGIAFLAASGCDVESGDGSDDAGLITGPREVCYGVTLDLSPSAVEETNHVLSGRRHFDREPLCWTFDQQVGATPGAVTFTLSRTFAIGDDGTRYGCRFTGSGNALRASVNEGSCVIPDDTGHVRMVLAEPADVQIQNIHSSLVVLNLTYEEARVPWMRSRGMARLSMANQDSVLQGLDRGELDLDSTGPDADPWATACPELPVCVQVDLTGSATLLDVEGDASVCEAWIAPLQYGVLAHRIDEDGNLDWQDEGTTIYRAVRALDACTVLGFADSLDTRDDYIADLDAGTFRMELRAYHQAMIDGIPRTSFCHGVWSGPLTIMPCPAR